MIQTFKLSVSNLELEIVLNSQPHSFEKKIKIYIYDWNLNFK